MINTGELGLNLDPNLGKLEFLDSGADSSVYRLGEDVIKFYKEGKITLPQILLYQRVTNEAAKLLSDDPVISEINIGETKFSYSLTVNPITFVGVDPRFGNKIISISPFIPGVNLSGGPDMPPYEGFIYQPFFNREVNRELDDQMETLSESLNKKLGITGIVIINKNMKVSTPNNPQKPVNIIITDLSANVWGLKEIV